MNDIEQKALALMNAIRVERDTAPLTVISREEMSTHEAVYRAIEQHEAFRREVSDAVMSYFQPYDSPVGFQRFIISKPKPDPLVDVFCRGLWSEAGLSISTKEIRAALDARGLEIRKKNDD